MRSGPANPEQFGAQPNVLTGRDRRNERSLYAAQRETGCVTEDFAHGPNQQGCLHAAEDCPAIAPLCGYVSRPSIGIPHQGRQYLSEFHVVQATSFTRPR